MTRADAFISWCGGFTMKRSVLVGAAASAAFALAASSAAQAGTVYDTSLAGGVYYGTGNNYSPENFAVTTEDGIEIGLRSHIRFDVAPASVGDLYVLPTGGAGFGFDFSYDPTNGIGDLSGVAASIEIQNLGNGASYTFDPRFIPDNSHQGGGYQNSEAAAYFNGVFPISNIGYDPNANDTYKITYRLTGVPTVGSMSVTNTVQIGSGAVPEPASWTLMIVGFGGIGACLRRRRQTAVAATA